MFMLLKITQIENEQEPDVKYFFDAWEPTILKNLYYRYSNVWTIEDDEKESRKTYDAKDLKATEEAWCMVDESCKD